MGGGVFEVGIGACEEDSVKGGRTGKNESGEEGEVVDMAGV